MLLLNKYQKKVEKNMFECKIMRIGHKYKKEENLADCPLPHIWVIRLGLEPKTPTLKVLCSTC